MPGKNELIEQAATQEYFVQRTFSRPDAVQLPPPKTQCLYPLAQPLQPEPEDGAHLLSGVLLLIQKQQPLNAG